MSVGGWFRELRAELKDRRAGRKAMGNDGDFNRSVRGIVGMTSCSMGKGPWDLIANDKNAYTRSLQKEPHLPPSLFISEADRVRLGQAAPLSERCIEDWKSPDAMPVRDWDISTIED